MMSSPFLRETGWSLEVIIVGRKNYAKESRDLVNTGSPLKILIDYVLATFTIAEMEIRKLRHDPTELLTRAVQPVL